MHFGQISSVDRNTALPVARRPYVLMNAAGGAGDVDTLLHEMGHAFHAFEVFRSPDLPYHQLQDYPTEFAEVASMSMELPGPPHLPAARGNRVECLRGRLWLTVEHDRRDILLGAGEGFTLDADAPVLLGAMADSNFIVLPGVTPWAG